MTTAFTRAVQAQTTAIAEAGYVIEADTFRDETPVSFRAMTPSGVRLAGFFPFKVDAIAAAFAHLGANPPAPEIDTTGWPAFKVYGDDGAYSYVDRDGLRHDFDDETDAKRAAHEAECAPDAAQPAPPRYTLHPTFGGRGPTEIWRDGRPWIQVEATRAVLKPSDRGAFVVEGERFYIQSAEPAYTPAQIRADVAAMVAALNAA